MTIIYTLKIYITIYVLNYINVYTYTSLSCILTSILALDNNRETISVCPLDDAKNKAVLPSYIFHNIIINFFIW